MPGPEPWARSGEPQAFLLERDLSGLQVITWLGLSIHSPPGHRQEKVSWEPCGLHIQSYVVDLVHCRDNWLLCPIPFLFHGAETLLYPKVSLDVDVGMEQCQLSWGEGGRAGRSLGFRVE